MRFLLLFLLCPLWAAAQKPPTPKSVDVDMGQINVDSIRTLNESNVVFFKPSSIGPDTAKAMLRVRVLEAGGKPAPIQGATVLLRRDNDKMLGRVTRHDGRCHFAPVPASYTVRVQMTGLKTLEKQGFVMEAGKVYDMEIVMGRN